MTQSFYLLPKMTRTLNFSRKIDAETFSKILMQLKDRSKCIFLLIYYTDISIDEILLIKNDKMMQLVLSSPELCLYSSFFAECMDSNLIGSPANTFLGNTGNLISRSNLCETLRIACEKAKIERITPTQLKEWDFSKQEPD